MTTRLRKISFSLMVLTILGLSTAEPAAAERLYCITNLGSFAGATPNDITYPHVNVTGINNLGQVVGTTNRIFITDSIFRTAPNSPINPATDDFGTVARYGSISGGINDLGQIVFYGITSIGEVYAYRSAPNSQIDRVRYALGALGTPFINPADPNRTPQSLSTYATAINNLGQVVGSSEYDLPSIYKGPYHAFRTAPNSPINSSTAPIPSTDDLGTLGGITSSATGINDKGEVVGSSTLPSGDTHAFRTAPNSPINSSTDDLGTLGGITSSATGINYKGEVVGSSTLPSGDTHAFRTDPYQPIDPARDDLGTLGGTSSRAYGINRKGEVVGTSSLEGEQASHAFLYFKGHMKDLNSLVPPNCLGGFSVLNQANAINNKGQIAGSGTLDPANDKGQITSGVLSTGFLATPIDHKVSP